MSKRKTISLAQGRRYYDAADTGTARSWGSYAAISEDYFFDNFTRPIVLGRFRREVRNNPFLAGLYSKFPEAMGETRYRSRSGDKQFNEAKDQFFYKWGRFVTLDGDSLGEVESFIWNEMLVAGELFFVKHLNGRLQLIPSEFCGSYQANTEGEVNGIGYTKGGRPKYYRFGKMNEQGMIDFTQSSTVPARHVIHLYRKDRVSMGRGLPWLLSSLAHARDLADICSSKTSQIKSINKITGFLEVAESDNYMDQISDAVDEAGNPIVEDVNSPADANQHADTAERVIKLEDGQLFILDKGEKANMLKSEYGADDYKELVMLMLHSISAPLGLPVELWFSGLGDVNFSGFKGLGTVWLNRRKHYHKFLDLRFHRPVYYWRLGKAINEGDLGQTPEQDEDLFDFMHSKASVLDEEREAKANKTKLETGECCLSEIWETNGCYTEEVFEARKQVWIKAQVAAGELTEDVDPETVKVPMEFLLFNKLPGMEPGKPSDNPKPKKPDQAETDDEETND